MKKLVLLVAGIALLTVACRAEINVLVDIEEDRSGTIAFEFGLDEEFRELIESSGGTTDDLFGEFDLGIDGGTVTERTEGDMVYTGATQDFEDISAVMADLIGDTSGEGLFTEFSFVMDDETAALSATAAANSEDFGGEMPFDPSALTDDVFSANFILGMPGTVVEHNADEVLSDGRLLWSLPILGGTKTFVAKSEFGGGSSLWWLWIILGVVVVVGAAAIVAAIVLGKRKEKRAVTDAASQDPQALSTAPAAAAELDAELDAAVDAAHEVATDEVAETATDEVAETATDEVAETATDEVAESVSADSSDDGRHSDADAPAADDSDADDTSTSGEEDEA